MDDNHPAKGFAGWVALLRDLATVVAIGGTVAFFLSPQLERWLAETFGIKAWYFATELLITEERGGISKNQGAENFYHFLWARGNDFAGSRVANDAEALEKFLSVLETLEGNIVFKTEGQPTPGRESIRVASQILTLAKPGECFRVLETRYDQGRMPLPHNIYLRLVRVPCL